MASPEISVVIVSYNVWDYLKPCIASILQQVAVSIEVIVVDNNSSDNTVSNLRQEFSGVQVIANTSNKGFSGANNQGIAIAKGKYILLLNPDTEIKHNDTLQKMRSYADINKFAGVLAPCLLNTDGSFQPSFWTTSTLEQLFLELGYMHKFVTVRKPSQPTSVRAASGAALFFNKEMLNKTGLLDENMFWMEDIDFCYRVTKAGYTVLYDPAVEVVHHGGKSSSNYSVVIPNQVMSKVKFYKKNGNWFQYLLILKIAFWFIISRWFSFALLSLSMNNTFLRKRKAYGITFKAYFSYLFSDNGGIINIGQ